MNDSMLHSNRAMWRGALLPSLLVTSIGIAIFSVGKGFAGFLGASLAGFTVVIYFSISLLVARLTRHTDPIATMAVAMFSYFTKLLFFALFLLLVTKLTSESSVNRIAFGATSIAAAFAWLTGEVRAFFRLRLELPLPDKTEPDRGSSNER